MITSFFFFFFNDTPTTEIYTLSLHDALPISTIAACDNGAPTSVTTAAANGNRGVHPMFVTVVTRISPDRRARSEEHTYELQSQSNLVCRLLLEKKKKTKYTNIVHIKCNKNTK